MRIIVNALSGIGDAVMFSPALKVLKSHIPDAEIEMMVMFKAVQHIYENNPHIRRVHFIDFLNQGALKSLSEVRALRRNNYDASINVYPSNRREYNVVNRLLGAKKRIAAAYIHSSSAYLEFLNNLKSQEIKNKHNVLENLELVKLLVPSANEDELGPYEIILLNEHKAAANQIIESAGLSGKMLIGFHAGSATFKRHINKRWAFEKFADLAKQLGSAFNAKILLFGTEADVNNKIAEIAKDAVMIPQESNIMNSIALIEKCKLFVSNDAALMHIASAMQVPTVAIFGYTNYKELHPWKSKYTVVRKELDCSPCFYNSPRPVHCIYSGKDEFKCIKTIEVAEVMEACRKLIEEVPGNIKS